MARRYYDVSYDFDCIAAIYGLLQGAITAQTTRVVVKHSEESTYDFLQRAVGMHGGMKVSCDLGYGTYLLVNGLSEKVHDCGYGLYFGRREYELKADCVVSWKTNCGNYSTVHLYKLSSRVVDEEMLECYAS